MPQYLDDISGNINIGGALVKFEGVAQSGGELIKYDGTPVGGPPAGNYHANVRSEVVITITMPVPGADAAAQEAFIATFAPAKVFDCVASPATSSQIGMVGVADIVGRTFIVSSRPQIKYDFQKNADLTVTLTESGASS